MLLYKESIIKRWKVDSIGLFAKTGYYLQLLRVTIYTTSIHKVNGNVNKMSKKKNSSSHIPYKSNSNYGSSYSSIQIFPLVIKY